MDIIITPRKLSGRINAIPSKSQAHRVLICAAFSDKPTQILCPSTNDDIEATAGCLRSLGADILRTNDGYFVSPCRAIPERATLDCKESGSTLRFMLPIVGALGVDATFLLSGRLPQRPLSPLWEEMERHNCHLSRPNETSIRCCGQLTAGIYTIDGGVSSQFITGLLFALSLISEKSRLEITGKAESKPYIDMTMQVLSLFGKDVSSFQTGNGYPFTSPEVIRIEGDWSNGAFFIAANAMGNNIIVDGLSDHSAQGDKRIVNILNFMDKMVTVDASDIPDLVPILAVCAAARHGAIFTNIERLRLKESDRVAAVSQMLWNLGGEAIATEHTLTVYPTAFHSCTVDSCGDHRIAMATAIAATVADGPVTVLGAQCVAKSYPSFWEEYKNLGGSYEQYIR